MKLSPEHSDVVLQTYSPGLHILAELKQVSPSLLSGYSDMREFWYKEIQKHKLNPLGEVFHDFPGGGFTGVICLTESHMAIHTWPEFGIITLDVFLSNYKKSNEELARSIIQSTIQFFDCTDFHLNEISR